MKRINEKKNNNPLQPKRVGAEQNKYVLDLVNSWIVAADNKISIAFAIFAVIFGAFNWLSLKDIGDVFRNNGAMFIVIVILLSASTILFAVSLIVYIFILKPNHYSSNKKKEYSIFYEEIATFDSPDSYQATCEQATEDQFNKELMHETYYNSKVCSRKMRLFRVALLLSTLSLLLGLIASITSTIAYQTIVDANAQIITQISLTQMI